VSTEPERANAQGPRKGTSDNPFLTPPEAFVKDQPDLYQPLEDCRRRRTGHPRVGALAQHQPLTRLPRRRATGRVRSHVLRFPTERPNPGRNPIARASGRTRAIHTVSLQSTQCRSAADTLTGRPTGIGEDGSGSWLTSSVEKGICCHSCLTNSRKRQSPWRRYANPSNAGLYRDSRCTVLYVSRRGFSADQESACVFAEFLVLASRRGPPNVHR
jgi:hypothetical protein